MTEVWLSLGSNCGDRKKNVSDAMSWLPDALDSFACSDIYETPEIHGIGDPYYNAVIRGISSRGFYELNRLFKEYELSSGRDSASRERGDVPIDIDIVVWDKDIIRPKDFYHSFFQIGYMQIQSEL